MGAFIMIYVFCYNSSVELPREQNVYYVMVLWEPSVLNKRNGHQRAVLAECLNGSSCSSEHRTPKEQKERDKESKKGGEYMGRVMVFESGVGLDQSHELQIQPQYKEQLSNIVHIPPKKTSA